MDQKPLLLSDVPKDIISQWNELPVDIDDLKELTEMIVKHPWVAIARMTNIEDQINIIIPRLEHLRLEPMTLEQYAYSFLYFDSQKMRNIYKVIYDYFEKHQSRKKEEITISLLDDDEDVSEVIVIDDDHQPATSSQSTKDGRICGICFEREVDGIILPCAHMCCYQCASDKRIKLCPEFSCRKPVEKVIKGQFI